MTEYESRKELPSEAREQIRSLVGIVQRPEFTSLLEEIENTPAHERPEVAQRLSTVGEFRERGLPIPEGLRITTRVFENPDDPRLLATSIVDDRRPEIVAERAAAAARPTLCVSVGFIVCVTIGDEI